MFSSATQPPRPPPRHNCVVSAITFEGFKLRSSNLTHALLIQISRTSSIIDIVAPSKMADGDHFVQKKIKKKVAHRSVLDLKWPEMPSKVNFGHPKWPIDLKWSEMRSKVIFGHQKWPPKKIIFFCINLKWPELGSKVNFGNPKWPIDLKWPEMRSKMNFRHPKWPMSAILSKISKKNK